MIFIVLTFLAALSIEGLGTLVSVIGLSALFGSNPIIIALVVALDLGKLVSVSLLYTHWRDLPKLMKGYAIIAATVLMVITSSGAAGYLSSEFQKAIVGTQEGSLKVDVLKQQQAKYEERKRQIDAQIAGLSEKTTVNQRLRLMNGFKAEQQDLQDKITKIDQDLPALQLSQINTEAHAGPILYIAKAFQVPVETAVKWVILMIIFVFDPLAIFLIISGNFLLAKRREAQAQETVVVEKAKPVPQPVEPEPQVIEKNFLAVAEAEETLKPPQEDSMALHESIIKNSDRWKPVDQPISAVTPEEVVGTKSAEEPAQEQEPETTPSDEVLPVEAPIVEQTPEPERIVETPAEEVPTKDPSRETITLSTLGLNKPKPLDEEVAVSSLGSVKADPTTVVDASSVDQVTPFRSSVYPRRTTKPTQQ